jgi:hypothetical protein
MLPLYVYIYIVYIEINLHDLLYVPYSLPTYLTCLLYDTPCKSLNVYVWDMDG